MKSKITAYCDGDSPLEGGPKIGEVIAMKTKNDAFGDPKYLPGGSEFDPLEPGKGLNLKTYTIEKTKTSYTPGPWDIQDADYQHIPIMAGDFTRDVCEVTRAGIDEDEQTANARLISAAPELLAALEMATAELQSMHTEYLPGCKGGCPTLEIIAKARAAIAKAKGA